MPLQRMTFDTTFHDFQLVQRHMARRLFAKNRRSYWFALSGVVLCSTFLTMAIVAAAHPYRSRAFFSDSLPPETSFLLLIVLYLVGAILSLLPAIGLRLRTLRMQVSKKSPFLGETTLVMDEDGLTIERPLMRSKYLWAAFQGVDIVKNALILPVDNGIGIVIPASAFSSDAARYSFAAEVSKRIER